MKENADRQSKSITENHKTIQPADEETANQIKYRKNNKSQKYYSQPKQKQSPRF